MWEGLMRWYTFLLCVLISVLVSQCTTVRQSSRETYRKQTQEIEDAYRNQEITKAEYLRLKMQAENAFQQREATIAGGSGR
jgi:hypothetical protein